MKESSFVVQVLLELQATSSEEGMLWIKRTSRRAMREKKRRRRRRGGTRGGERGEKEGRKGKKGGNRKARLFLIFISLVQPVYSAWNHFSDHFSESMNVSVCIKLLTLIFF
jgi:hypothetical protein